MPPGLNPTLPSVGTRWSGEKLDSMLALSGLRKWATRPKCLMWMSVTRQRRAAFNGSNISPKATASESRLRNARRSWHEVRQGMTKIRMALELSVGIRSFHRQSQQQSGAVFRSTAVRSPCSAVLR